MRCLNASERWRHVAVVNLVAFNAQRFARELGLKLADFGERRIAQKLSFGRSIRQLLGHVQIDATILATSIKRLVDPLGTEGQIDTFAVTHEKESEQALTLQ